MGGQGSGPIKAAQVAGVVWVGRVGKTKVDGAVGLIQRTGNAVDGGHILPSIEAFIFQNLDGPGDQLFAFIDGKSSDRCAILNIAYNAVDIDLNGIDSITRRRHADPEIPDP